MTLPKRAFHAQIKPGAIIPAIPILEQLVKGYTYFTAEISDSDLKKHWNKSRDFVMGLTGQDIQQIVPKFFFRGVPVPWGSRCHAWWLFDSPEPRRILTGANGVIPESGYSFGRPRLYKSLTAFNSVVFESQPAYLQRLNLLLPGEAEKIKPGLIRI